LQPSPTVIHRIILDTLRANCFSKL
jgi:hypothetical protein